MSGHIYLGERELYDDDEGDYNIKLSSTIRLSRCVWQIHSRDLTCMSHV